MTPAQVTIIIIAVAKAFNLVVEDVLAFVRQQNIHPELGNPPPADQQAAIDAAIDRLRTEHDKARGG
jgi:hypothetical protein